jgi:hypothetical protein
MLPPAPKRSIELLPLAAVIGRRGAAALQHKTCRHSRRGFLDLSLHLEAETYSTVLIQRLTWDVPLKDRLSILQDNGVEHAKHQEVDAALGTECHAVPRSEGQWRTETASSGAASRKVATLMTYPSSIFNGLRTRSTIDR